MRTASNWKDYVLLDAADGEKLEKWGGISLVRPDPQIIWKTEKTLPLWKTADGHYHRSNQGGGKWEFSRKIPDAWTINYRELTFNIRPTGFKHTGLFPEQAVNWDFMADKIRNANREINVLNLFAYTGGATLACAAAGASVCHVDASKGMVQWAKENARSSSVEDKSVRWLVDDCVKFVEREIRRGNHYDIIIMDPPSYGRGPGGEIWKLEDEVYGLCEKSVKLLTDDSLMFLISSYTTGLSPAVMEYILASLIKPEFGGTASSDELGLPVTASGGILPCGSAAVWKK